MKVSFESSSDRGVALSTGWVALPQTTQACTGVPDIYIAVNSHTPKWQGKFETSRVSTSEGTPFHWLGGLLSRKKGDVVRAAEVIIDDVLKVDKRVVREANKIIGRAGDRVQEDMFRDARAGLIKPEEFWH